MLSTEELRACGLSDDAISTRVVDGSVHPRHRGVLAVGHPDLRLEGRFLAAVKACGPAALLGHVAGATLLGGFVWDHRPVDVTVLGAGTRRHAGVKVRLTRRLDPRDVWRVKGIPATSPARTALDCAAGLGDHERRRTVREFQARGLVTAGDLAEILVRAVRRPSRASGRPARLA